jgi:hypothetical protein
VTQAWIGDGLDPLLSRLCGSPAMVEPNDLAVASNGRVFTSGMRWAENNVKGTCLRFSLASYSELLRTAASNGRVFTSGMRWAESNVKGKRIRSAQMTGTSV